MTSHALRKLFSKYAQSSTLRTFTKDGSTDRQGQPTYTENTQSLDVIVAWEGSHPSVIEQALGESIFVEEQLFALTEDVTLDVETNATGKKPLIVVGNDQYKVERSIEDPAPNTIGLTMFQCQRERASA